MNVQLPLLLLGIALLWFPRRWMRLGASLARKRRRKTGSNAVVEPWHARETGDPHVSFAAEFRKFRNYIDLLRATVGGIVIAGGIGIPPSLAAGEDASRAVVLQVMAIRAFVLLVGVLVQTVRREHGRFSFTPPIFFLAGISVALCDVRPAFFAFGLIWGVSAALPNSQAFLTVYALLMVVFGHLFARAADLTVILSAALTFLPVMLSLLAKRPLLIMTRRATRMPHM